MDLHGPKIVVRSMSIPGRADRTGNRWQYHSRSDHHSKVGCWAIMFDLLMMCGLLRSHASNGQVCFGINHEMVDFRNNRKKNLDLVVCTPRRETRPAKPRNLTSLVQHYAIALSETEQSHLAALPTLQEAPVGSVLMALEAKACMTAHQRALPRLYDELNSSHQTIHGATDQAIAAGFVMVNAATAFLSPDQNKGPRSRDHLVWSRHNQPRDATLAISKVEEIPRRSNTGETGFDALAVMVIECRNDGTPVKLITSEPAPQPGEIFHYATLVERLSHIYSTRFAHL